MFVLTNDAEFVWQVVEQKTVAAETASVPNAKLSLQAAVTTHFLLLVLPRLTHSYCLS